MPDCIDSAQEQAYASAALLQVAQAVAKSNNLDETIGSVVRITPILVGVKACAIYLLEKTHFTRPSPMVFRMTVQILRVEREFPRTIFPCWMPFGILTDDGGSVLPSHIPRGLVRS